MIRLIQGDDCLSFKREIDEMHRIRCDVFQKRLGWDVNVVGEWEIDEFDEANPLYVVSVHRDTGRVQGSLRLLPTTGPNMLRDVFGELLPDGDVIESPLVWESSRFSVHHLAEGERDGRGINRVTGELLAGMCEVGMLAGLSQIVTVYDARIARIIRQAGARGEIIGRPKRIGRVMTYAGLFDTDQTMLDNIRASCGITGSVLEKDTVLGLRVA